MRPFFIVGVQRSGTTLLSVMLRKHPAIYLEERALAFRIIAAAQRAGKTIACNLTADRRKFRSWLIRNDLDGRLAKLLDHDRAEQYGSWQELVRHSIEKRLEEQKRSMWADKAPNLQHFLPDLRLLLPQARFIHIVRDGRANAYSLSRRSSRSLLLSAQQWVDGNIQAITNQEWIGLDDYLIIRYEDLLRKPEATMRQVCTFLELPFSEAILDPSDDQIPAGERYVKSKLDPDKIDAFRQQLSPRDMRQIEQIQAPLLQEFGYELLTDVSPQAYRPLSVGRRILLQQADNVHHLFQRRRKGMDQRQLVETNIPFRRRAYTFLRRLAKDFLSDPLFHNWFNPISDEDVMERRGDGETERRGD